jgi:hypothetical protein
MCRQLSCLLEFFTTDTIALPGKGSQFQQMWHCRLSFCSCQS